MTELVKQISRYIQHLNKEYEFQITIHGFTGMLSNFIELVPYNIHENSYCLYVKTNKDVWNQCICRQQKVIEHCQNGIFYGMCYAGVEEYVLPVTDGQGIIGFVSVSGYRTDPEQACRRMEILSKKYLLDKEQLKQIYQQHLREPPPPQMFVDTMVSPLCAMLRLLYITWLRIYETMSINDCNSDYIYSYIIHYLNRNYNQRVTLEQIASQCHCSKSYIMQIFKHKGKGTVWRYITGLRMEKARMLLTESRLQIGEISERIGYSDSNYFTNTFRKENGISPSAYRNQFRQIEKEK